MGGSQRIGLHPTPGLPDGRRVIDVDAELDHGRSVRRAGLRARIAAYLHFINIRFDIIQYLCILFNVTFNIFKSPVETPGSGPAGSFDIRRHPLARLPEEDLNLIVELVLRSGSLKALAESYRVSYPTIRTRLDRVIERLEAAVAGKQPDPINELLASLVEKQQLSMSGARAIRDAIRAAQNETTPGGNP